MFFRTRMCSNIKKRLFAKANTLLAGPWVGEFGWEIFCWQGYLRARSREFERVIISSRPEMEPLYTDFCHEFIPFICNEPGDSRYKNPCYKHCPDISDQRDFKEYISGKFDIGYNLHNPPLSSKAFLQQEFCKYGKYNSSLAHDVVLHIRQTNKKNSAQRDGWDSDEWYRFVDNLQRKVTCNICCIGDINASGSLDGCVDMRGLSLSELFDLLASSRAIVGPSSGPMHLGALCGCPQVVWSGQRANQYKYEKYWNPFSVPVKYIHDPDWKPCIDPVVKFTLEILGA